jgi:hypothetical protein
VFYRTEWPRRSPAPALRRASRYPLCLLTAHAQRHRFPRSNHGEGFVCSPPRSCARRLHFGRRQQRSAAARLPQWRTARHRLHRRQTLRRRKRAFARSPFRQAFRLRQRQYLPALSSSCQTTALLCPDTGHGVHHGLRPSGMLASMPAAMSRLCQIAALLNVQS